MLKNICQAENVDDISADVLRLWSRESLRKKPLTLFLVSTTHVQCYVVE